jgi:hypothetical protein
MDWKNIASKLVEEHTTKESSVVSLDPHSIGELVNLSNDDFCLEIEGKELKTKRVRKFLWENRKKRALQRRSAVIWSAYLQDEDKSYVGVGALTTKRVADKMASRHG